MKPIYFGNSAFNYAGLPDIGPLGIKKLTEITPWGFYRKVNGVYDEDHIDMDTCRRVANDPEFWKGRESDMIVLDEEMLKQSDPDLCRRDIVHDELIEALKIYREARPGQAIGYYARLPEHNFYGPLGNSGYPEWAHYKDYYAAWVEHNKYLNQNINNKTLERVNRGLSAQVDRVFPSCYCNLAISTLPDFIKWWKIVIDGNVEEAAKYNKPIYPYLSPQFNGRLHEGFLPKGMFGEILEHTLSNPLVDGVVIYQTVPNQTPFDATADWWVELLAVLDNQKSK